MVCVIGFPQIKTWDSICSQRVLVLAGINLSGCKQLKWRRSKISPVWWSMDVADRKKAALVAAASRRLSGFAGRNSKESESLWWELYPRLEAVSSLQAGEETSRAKQSHWIRKSTEPRRAKSNRNDTSRSRPKGTKPNWTELSWDKLKWAEPNWIKLSRVEPNKIKTQLDLAELSQTELSQVK